MVFQKRIYNLNEIEDFESGNNQTACVRRSVPAMRMFKKECLPGVTSTEPAWSTDRLWTTSITTAARSRTTRAANFAMLAEDAYAFGER